MMTLLKMSEAGMIPYDWSAIQVRDIGKIKNGINKPKEAFGSGTPFVNLMDVFGKSSIGTATALELLETTKTERNTYNLKAGDVLFIRSSVKPSGVGLTTLVKQDLPDTVFSGFLLRFRDSGNLDVAFKEHCFHASYFRNSLIDNSTISANTNINQSALGRLWLIVPPLHEQQAIATALSDADEVVAGLERAIAKKLRIKQGAMQDLLTARRRLPGFSGEWEVKRLGDLVTVIMGQSPSSSTYNSKGEGLPLIQGNADIKDRKAIIRAFTRQITKLGQAGDYLMSVRAPVGEISATDMDVCLGRGVCALRTDERIIYHIMVAKEPEWAKLSTGSTFDSVNGSAIRAFEVLFPKDRTERLAVAQVLDDMDAEIQTLESRLTKARAVKEGMMQNLLTGRVRLV